eukprot:SAG11_NODE_24103_length_378_cov_0.741935_1_plen_52_part_10
MAAIKLRRNKITRIAMCWRHAVICPSCNLPKHAVALRVATAKVAGILPSNET